MTHTQYQNILILNILKWSKNSVSGWPAWPGPSLSVISALFLIEVFASPQILASLAPSHVKPGLTAQTTARTRESRGNILKSFSCGYLWSKSCLKELKCLYCTTSCLRICQCSHQIYSRVISLAPRLPLLFSDPHQSRSRHDIISILTPHSSVLEIRILITSPQPQPGSHDSSCRDLMPLCCV